ncbi:MAG: hypothetical protein ABI885_26795 [Gammaproteobacteria bacterium]
MSNLTKRAEATAALLLVAPGSLFIAALFVRSLQSQNLEPARTANQLVMWYVGLGFTVGLWGLLVALPLAALCLGSVALLQGWAADADLRHAMQQTLMTLQQYMATAVVTAATLMAAGILVIVVMHMLTN